MAIPERMLRATPAATVALADELGIDALIDSQTFRILLMISPAAFERWLRAGRIPQPDIAPGKGRARRWKLSVVRKYMSSLSVA